MEDKYIRMVQTGVTNFLFCGDEVLLLKRNDTKRVDPGMVNGVGGRLEPGEDYLSAAIRETEEETGYVVEPKDVKLSGVVKLEGGYQEDWVMCFFKIEVATKEIPLGSKTEDGELIWIHKNKVLDSGLKLVDDLNYCFKDIIASKGTFFMTCTLDKSIKIINTEISKIN